LGGGRHCLEQNGTASLVQVGSDVPKLVGRFRLLSRRVHDAWAHPVLHDGRLYLRYHDTLWCYDVKQRNTD
jgi:hypothetical protein